MPNVLLNKVIHASAPTAYIISYLLDGIRFQISYDEIIEGKYGNNWFKVDMETPYYIDYIAYAIRQSPFGKYQILSAITIVITFKT